MRSVRGVSGHEVEPFPDNLRGRGRFAPTDSREIASSRVLRARRQARRPVALLTTNKKPLYTPVGYQKVPAMLSDKTDVLHGSLALMVLRTLDTLGPQHGWGIARRIEQISGDVLALNQGTLYPALLRLEQMGWISSKRGASENNRRAKFYAITRAGKKQLAAESENWERMSDVIARFLKPSGETS
jgi:PadR family transcriptional regulator PadR